MPKTPKLSPKLESLISAGQILSNIVFNLSQISVKKQKALFEDSYKKWDEALKNFKK